MPWNAFHVEKCVMLHQCHNMSLNCTSHQSSIGLLLKRNVTKSSCRFLQLYKGWSKINWNQIPKLNQANITNFLCFWIFGIWFSCYFLSVDQFCTLYNRSHWTNRSRILDDSHNNQVTTTWPSVQGPNLICCHLSSLPDGPCPCFFPVASSLVSFFLHLCFLLNSKGKQCHGDGIHKSSSRQNRS